MIGVAYVKGTFVVNETVEKDVAAATAQAIQLAAIIGTYFGDEPLSRASAWPVTNVTSDPGYMVCWGDDAVEGYVIRLCQFGKRVIVHIDTNSDMPDSVWRKCLTIIGYCAYNGHECRAENWPGIEELLTAAA